MFSSDGSTRGSRVLPQFSPTCDIAYFTGIGIAAFFPAIGTPVTAAAFLGGWAISAGVGSAYHYFGIE